MERTDLSEKFDAVGIGQPHVEHQDVRGLGLELGHGLGTGAGELHLEPRPEETLVTDLQGLLVLDEQDAASLSICHKCTVRGRER